MGPAKKKTSSPGRKTGRGITRRTFLKGAGAAMVVAVLGRGVLGIRSSRKIAAMADGLKANKVFAPQELARLAVHTGLNEMQARYVARITNVLKTMDNTMTHGRIFETIGRNFADNPGRNCKGIADAVRGRISVKRGRISKEEIARLERVIAVFEELKKLEESNPNEFNNLKRKLKAAYPSP